MRLKCPRCGSEILSENISIDTALAKCHCGEVFSISGTVKGAGAEVGEIAPAKPVDTKVVIEESPSNDVHIWIPGGFRPSVIGLIVFALIWNGFIGFFSYMMIRENEGPPFLFLVPFYLVGIGLIVVILWMIFGKSSIHVNSLGLAIVKELFGIRRRSVIPLEVVGEISVIDTGTRVNNVPVRAIAIKYGEKTAKVGRRLSEAERQWLAYEIRQYVAKLKP